MVLSLVAILVGIYAVAVARPQYDRVRSEWLQAAYSDSDYENLSSHREDARSHLQMLTVMAGLAGLVGMVLGILARKREGGTPAMLAVVLGLVGVV